MDAMNILFGLSAVACLAASASAGGPDVNMEERAAKVVGRHKAVFTRPPRRIPSSTAVDAPLLGNGDMGVALSGPPQAQRFWLAKNDFWRFNAKYKSSPGPRVFGGVDVAIPELAGAGYRVEQKPLDAVTTATFTKGELTVTMRTWVANILGSTGFSS